ncbi:MAG: hypothetical protein RLY82_25, partial [Pseudomonadota bacterium]
MGSAMTEMTLLESYGQYVAQSQSAALALSVIHHAKRALLDWQAALITGSDVPTATLLKNAYA